MKKSTIIVIVVIVLIAIWGITSYNGMVKMDESVIGADLHLSGFATGVYYGLKSFFFV